MSDQFLNELDHLNRLLIQCRENVDKFKQDDTEAGRHWFCQFQLEALRLQKEKDRLLSSR